MKGKNLVVLLAVLMIGIYMCASIGMAFYVPSYPQHKTSFDLQQEYAKSLEKKLIDLLEPVVGVGNVRASVMAEIKNQNTTQTWIDFKNATRTVVHENGPILVTQSVSVLINEKDENKFPSYQNLIKGAIGFDVRRGDYLILERLPFIKVPLWTLGLSPIVLMRIGTGLILLILIGIFWLIREWIHSKGKVSVPYYLPDEKLWKQAENLSCFQLADQLKIKRPEITAFILYYLSQDKRNEIIELFSEDYREQVFLHLNHIEKLDSAGKTFLLKEAEKKLREILKNLHSGKTESLFEELINWTDENIQKLLYYVSKQDLIKALQYTSLSVQQIFARNVPPAIWQELIKKVQENPCLKTESYEAQEKIIHIAQLLKEKR